MLLKSQYSVNIPEETRYSHTTRNSIIHKYAQHLNIESSPPPAK